MCFYLLKYFSQSQTATITLDAVLASGTLAGFWGKECQSSYQLR